MWQRILVTTGGSPWSDAAVAYATTLAALTGAELCVLTVLVNPWLHAHPDVMGGEELVVDIVERDGQALLARAAAQARQTGVACETVSRWGHVPQTILQTAAENHADLIVLGARGVNGRKRLRLGSISNAVAAKASQPILVVKQPLAVAPGAPLGRRVLVATGGSPWSDVAVAYALRLAQVQQLEVCILHVDRGRPHRGEDPAAAEGKSLLTLAEAQAAAMGVTYEGTLASGDVAQAILETAATKQCDGIILGSRGLTGWKRLMLGSISNTVATKASQPVLIVKRFLDV